MHEHNGLTTSKQLIRELNAIDGCAGHLLLHDLAPDGRVGPVGATLY